MSSEAKFVPSGRRYRVRTAEERERAFRSAKRHSRVVGILRKVLPVLAVLVLACYFISTRLSVSVGDLTASISGIQIADGNLRMTNPKLQGNDKKNGSYVVSAEYADQGHEEPEDDQASRNQGRSVERERRLVADGGRARHLQQRGRTARDAGKDHRGDELGGERRAEERDAST